MQLNQKMRMMNFAAIAVMMSLMIIGTNGQGKHDECCTFVSTSLNSTLPITRFRLQHRNPPCVNAVIFYTSDGNMWCTSRKENWVRQKVQELRKLQRGHMKMNSTVSTPLSTTSV